MPRIELSSTTSITIIIALAVAAAAFSFFFYRYTLPPVPKVTRLVLGTLRALALFLICILLFQPLARILFFSTRPPTLAVLIDNSKSMRLVDRAGDRADQLRAILREDATRMLPAGGDVRTYTFGSRLASLDARATDSLTLNEDITDISAALRALAREQAQYNIQAALLLTDGNYNSGQNPVYDAEQLAMPVYTVGIGDSSEQKDLLITKILTNDIAYSGSPTPVAITIRSAGFGGERVEVALSESGRELFRAPLTLESGTHEYQISLSYTPEGTGTQKYTVTVSALPGELTRENNRKSFFVRVLKSRLRVLMIAGTPSPDVSMTRQTLTEEKSITVRCFTQRVPSGFYEGQLLPMFMDSTDCLLLLDFPTSTTMPQTLEIVQEALIKKSLPVLYITGKNVNDGRLRALLPVLPFTPLTTSSWEQYVSVRPAVAQKANPILKISTLSGDEAWNRLPPIFRTGSTYKKKAEATVLAYAEMQTVVLTDPIILTRSVNRQKSLAILAYGLWRWQLLPSGDPEVQRVLRVFLSNSIRWLTTEDERRPVRVTTTKETYTQGEPIEFVGQVYDASAQPIDNAEVKVTVQRGQSSFEALLRPIGNGRYEGTADGLGEGEYTFKAIARVDNQSLGEDRGRFSVGELNLEFQDTRMNSALLRQLAYRTNGRYLTAGTLSELPTLLHTQSSFVPTEVARMAEFELWNWRYTLMAIVLLLGLEWFVRKRHGML